MSLLYIKESYVYQLPDREMHCHTDGCGYWRANDDHSMADAMPLRMFKVNGAYCCEACLLETMNAICDAVDDVGDDED